MKQIKTVGVVGSGTMGSALAQKFAQEGFKVVLVDREQSFIDKGMGNIHSMLAEGVKKSVFSEEQVLSTLSNIYASVKMNDLEPCDLVIEAIYENFQAKTDLFSQLSKIMPAGAILATNTSSFSVTELSGGIKNPERFIGLHFFYHAAKNRLVEIIPGNKTSEDTYNSIRQFCVLAGKDAISCKDAYGFVVNRFFVPWLNEAVHLLDEKVASAETIDQVCMKTFGIGMGPFALMNATGVPVAYHAEKTLEVFGSFYLVAKGLKTQTELNKPWPLASGANSNGSNSLNADAKESKSVERIIRDRMLAAVFFVCSQLLDEEVCSSTDLNRGARIGLQWRKGPIDLMREFGQDEVTRLILQVVDRYNMNLPESIYPEKWKTYNVSLELHKHAAVITMDQPENMNALSEETMKQLEHCFTAAETSPFVDTIYITGSGKAFVAGADIKYFVNKIKNDKICDIETFTGFGQSVFQRIDQSKKKVIAVVNGMALGGGFELALCADKIISLPKAKFGFPETGIGIYPGLGGTQRSAKKIGKGLSKYLICTGKMLSAEDALAIGLVDQIIQPEDVFELFSGNLVLHPVEKKPLPEKWTKLKTFFETNSLDKITRHEYDHILSKEEAEKLVKTISSKAPIALKLADKLIEEAKGCSSELDHLREIFSTKDALLGLTSIGKRVEYQGK